MDLVIVITIVMRLAFLISRIINSILLGTRDNPVGDTAVVQDVPALLLALAPLY